MAFHITTELSLRAIATETYYLICGAHSHAFSDLCEDPTTCGINANCSTVNHKAVCACKPGYTGNPKIRCELGEDFFSFI